MTRRTAREKATQTPRPGHHLAALLLAVASMASAAQGPGVLGDLAGAHRVLLIFSPGEDDPLLERAEEALEASRCQVADRDMVIVRLPRSAVPTADGRPLPPEEASALRLRYRVRPDDFLMVLIGKDGGEKFRSDQPDVLRDVFRLIDTMPMRRAEMRAGPAPCPG